MTISNTTASITHLGNGVNTLWAYGFKIPDSSSVVVTLIDADTIETVIDATTFSISGIGSDSGGVVTYPLTGSPLADGYSIRIDRSVALTQTTGFSNQSGLINSLIESAFDKLTMIAQDTKALSARVVAASQSVLGYVSVAAGYAAQAAASAAYAAGVAAGNAVLFTTQTLSSGQQAQARSNIGAVASASLAAVATSGAYADLSGKPPLNAGAISTREQLTANRTYYVRTDGSDANNGLADTSGGAFLTIQKAVNVVGTLDLSGYTATIQVANGTYAGNVAFTVPTGLGSVALVGNVSTPASCIITGTGNAVSTSGNGVIVSVAGFTISTTGNYCIAAMNGSEIRFGSVSLGACASAHLSGAMHSRLYVTAAYTVTAGAPYHIRMETYSYYENTGFTVTVTGTPAFSAAFAQVWGAKILVSGSTWTGSATGKRYDASEGGVIAGTAGNTTLFPGSVAGTTNTNGLYT